MKLHIDAVLHSERRRNVVEVSSFKEASEAWRAFVKEEDIGASDMRGRCGEITTEEGVIAKVSYNGKVWLPEEDSWTKKPLYDPYENI